MKLQHTLYALGILVCVAVGGGRACGRQVCETAGGVRFCVEMKGPCALYHLVPREKTDMEMDMFHIVIVNRSDQPVKIVPEYFCGVTEDGKIIVLDPPLYESIELKKKLRAKEIRPQEQVDGFLFFPVSSGLVRSIIYCGDFYIEMLLY